MIIALLSPVSIARPTMSPIATGTIVSQNWWTQKNSEEMIIRARWRMTVRRRIELPVNGEVAFEDVGITSPVEKRTLADPKPSARPVGRRQQKVA
ncbi:MAG: hypothetical protein WBD41_00555 [Rhodococcus sp. (in: high G+C Gram-positive bacteria)]|uniref:hypothetical protein n=1 Tax=Rhodococcus sp. EPR-157 TaxID=1813677 RepID=UPI0018D4A8D8|nr:hypothetical protein [Rhodococcus sp. EPR-157]